ALSCARWLIRYPAPKNTTLNSRSDTTVLRKNGTPATMHVTRPFQVAGYISREVVQTAKLLTKKNDTDATSDAPTTRIGDELRASSPPNSRIAAYHNQVTV